MILPEKLPLREKICFGLGQFSAVLYWQTFSVYLLFFYTDVFGISAAAAGTLFLVSRLLDGALDPVMGMLADRTTTRWGKFRPYLLWTCVPFAIVGVLTFSTPDLHPGGKLVWAYVTYIATMGLFTVIMIPYTAMLGVMSPDPVQRTSLSSFQFVFAYLGSLVVSGSLLPMAKALGGNNAALGWQLSFLIYGGVFVVLMLVAFGGTRERVHPQPSQQTSIKRDLRDLVGNRPWVVLAVATVIFIPGLVVRNTVTPHYFKYFVGAQSVSLPFMGGPRSYSFIELVSAWGAVGQISSIVGVLLLGWFTRLLGKRQAFIILLSVSSVSTAAYYFLRPDQIPANFLLHTLASISGGPLSALLWSMYADAADYGEWQTGRRATGLVFSASIMGTKIGFAIGSACTAWLLSLLGFAANVASTPEVLHGVVLLMSLIPAGILAIAAGIMLFYPLADEKNKEISDHLRARRAGTMPTG